MQWNTCAISYRDAIGMGFAEMLLARLARPLPCRCLPLASLRRFRYQPLAGGGFTTWFRNFLVHQVHCGRRCEDLRTASRASACHRYKCYPSGDSSPSQADIKVTRDLVRAGQILKIEVLDHVIMGQGNFSSLKSLGYLYA